MSKIPGRYIVPNGGYRPKSPDMMRCSSDGCLGASGAEGYGFVPSLSPSGIFSSFPCSATDFSYCLVCQTPPLSSSPLLPLLPSQASEHPIPSPSLLQTSTYPFSCYNNFPGFSVSFSCLPSHLYIPTVLYLVTFMFKSSMAPHCSKMRPTLNTAFKAFHTHHQSAFPSTNPAQLKTE